MVCVGEWPWRHYAIVCGAQVNLLAGTKSGLLPASQQKATSLWLQVAGYKRVLLISPAYTYDGMYPFPTLHPYTTCARAFTFFFFFF